MSPTGDLRLTPTKVRHLSADDLDLEVPPPEAPPPGGGAVSPPGTTGAKALDIETLDAGDPVLATICDLLDEEPRYGGVVFTGPPGTSKSYYAARIGATLVDGDADRIRFVQFHPSYQYEDFVEGYVPSPATGSFSLEDKHFVLMCRAAEGDPDRRYVLVIDELSRGDPGRVFGEALTYVEHTKRGLRFNLASGRELAVPVNLVVLATMNPLDRGVDEVDAALERRFAKYAMEPDASIAEDLLTAAGMPDDLRGRVIHFFNVINAKARTNPHTALGHTYFRGISDAGGLRRLWEHQLRFHFEKAYRLDPDGLASVFAEWDRALAVVSAPPAVEVSSEASEAEVEETTS